MKRRKPLNARQLAREKILFRYSTALEQGDFEVIADVLRQAEADPTLERMLTEMNEVYSAELAPPIALPSLSANHNHRGRQEDQTVNITYPSIRRVPVQNAARSRWYSAATLAAALIALILFVAVLMARRSPNQPEQANSGIGLGGGTATPSLPATLPPTWTATLSATGTATLPPTWTPTPRTGTVAFVPVQEVGTVIPIQTDASVMCRGIINNEVSANGVDLYSDTSNSTIVGHLDLGTPVDILWQQSAAPIGVWNYVRAMPEDHLIEGWIQGEFVTPMDNCTIVIGQYLLDPCTGLGLSLTMPACSYATPMFDPPTNRFRDHTIQPEDTLISILIQYGISLQQLVELNPELFQGNCGFSTTEINSGCTILLTVGQTLRVPAYSAPFVTPTSEFELALASGGYDLITTEVVGDIPANTRVRITRAEFNGTERLYDVVAKDGQTFATAHAWQLMYAPGVTPGAATPTAVFGSALGVWSYTTITLQPIGDIPANTRVRIGSAWYNGTEWLYQITDETGRTADNARESQLGPAPGYDPSIPTPTSAYFDAPAGTVFTLEQIGSIPPNTAVIVSPLWYNGLDWVYGVDTLDGSQHATAFGYQLSIVSGQGGDSLTPTFVATPTAAYFGTAGQVLITLEQVGYIPANTLVQATSGYWNGAEWVYQILTLDGSTFAEARESQLAPVPGGTGYYVTPTPTFVQ
jgi:hypothetical protein